MAYICKSCDLRYVNRKLAKDCTYLDAQRFDKDTQRLIKETKGGK